MFYLISSLQQLYEASINSILQVGKLKVSWQFNLPMIIPLNMKIKPKSTSLFPSPKPVVLKH